MAFPGVKNELDGKLPSEMLLSWEDETEELLKTFHSTHWWQELLNKSECLKINSIQEMECFDEAWSDWLASDNEYAIQDGASMKAGAGKYMNLISVIARRI